MICFFERESVDESTKDSNITLNLVLYMNHVAWVLLNLVAMA